MGVYIVWIRIECIRNDNSAKQNVLRVSRGKALLAKTSYLHPILILSIPVMCRTYALLRRKLTHELPAKIVLVFNCLESSHTFSHTQPLQINPT